METICGSASRRARFREIKRPETHCFQEREANKKRLLLVLMFIQANAFWPAVFFYSFLRQENMTIDVHRIDSQSLSYQSVWLKSSQSDKGPDAEEKVFFFLLRIKMKIT